MKEHKWRNSWPGNFCLNCGIEDPAEQAELVECLQCKGPGCEMCRGTGVAVKYLPVPPCGPSK